MQVRHADHRPDIDAERVADERQLVGEGYIDVAEGVLDELREFGDARGQIGCRFAMRITDQTSMPSASQTSDSSLAKATLTSRKAFSTSFESSATRAVRSDAGSPCGSPTRHRCRARRRRATARWRRLH